MELKRKGATFVKSQNELLSLLNISGDRLKLTGDVLNKIPGHIKPEISPDERGRKYEENP
jgi:predicted acetyltransferase